ncbi:leucine rich adaptor protein 1-like [Cebidichthys violaceus]|uniref:leucine rich adaptor protein 1-like n=1 Tax=Cebidichthys violaceus TaxID=271503 RepID=UPI0035CAD9E0
MDEEILNDSFPDLTEVENKVGMKTPESLLIWMRDAADCEDGWRSDVVDRGDRSSAFSDSFSDKISSLKQEMRWLRSADVKILRQLVAVHEGIEAMRWLMEERGALASRGSSLTSSLSSLVTVEEHGLSMSPCRESQSPTQDLTENSGEESADHPPHADDGESNHKSYFDTPIQESTEERPPSPSTFKFESGETQTEHQTQESFRALQHNTMEEEESAPNRDSALLGYDAQWCWVESQDDVTFL